MICILDSAVKSLENVGDNAPIDFITDKTVFVTSQRFTGDLIAEADDLTGTLVANGLDAGDLICQKLADVSSLSGTYRARLSDDTGSPATRFIQATVPYVRTDGVKVADDYADLVDCSGVCLQATINRDETGGSPAGDVLVWTDTILDGRHFSTFVDCLNWTSDNGDETALVGNMDFTTSLWTQFVIFDSCDMFHRLYCFEQ